MAEVDPAFALQRMQDIDRRKLAAGRKAKDAQDAERRKLWRDSKRRQRERKLLQARKPQPSECERDNALAIAEKDKRFQQLFGETTPVSLHKENVIRNDLIDLSKDRRAPASARVTALRTLAEMDGHIGKLQQTVGDTSDQPLATMTREQLEKELARLRAQAASRDA